MRAQQEFLEKGLSHLRPLKMQEVADAVGIHVATVSRAIRHKYMETPRGLLPMKFFFTGGTQSCEGEMQTWDAVKERIKRLVEEEDKANPLSDDDIVKKLGDGGVHIARRTVTKYRKALNIPTSRQQQELLIAGSARAFMSYSSSSSCPPSNHRFDLPRTAGKTRTSIIKCAPDTGTTVSSLRTMRAMKLALPALIPRRDLFGNPDRASVTVSPDGTRLAFLAPVDGVLNVWVAPLASPEKAEPVTQDRRRGIRAYSWAYTSAHILYIQDKDGDENWHLYATRLDTKETRDLTPFPATQAGDPAGKPSVPGRNPRGAQQPRPEVPRCSSSEPPHRRHPARSEERRICLFCDRRTVPNPLRVPPDAGWRVRNPGVGRGATSGRPSPGPDLRTSMATFPPASTKRDGRCT